MRREAASRFKEVEAARARFGDELVDRIVAAAFESDGAADRLIEAFRSLPGGSGWRMLDQILNLGPDAVLDAPPELEELLRPVLDPPAWVDFDLVDAGAVAWWRVGALPQLVALTAGSLAFGYQSASFARPLAMTGRLTQMAPRRLGETSRWALAATRPGALLPGGAGVAATVRLRLVHALVRAHIRRQGGWDTANWGEPISVADTLATGVIGFFLFPLGALEDMGIRYSRAELEAVFHEWRWICFLMGVPEDQLPASLAEARTLMEAGIALDAGPNEDSVELVRALLYHGLAYDRFLPGPLAAVARTATAHAVGALARRWMGEEMADRLEVPNSPLKHLAPTLRPLNRARDALRAAGLMGSDERIVALELALAERVLAAMGAAPAQIQPEHVEQAPALAAA